MKGVFEIAALTVQAAAKPDAGSWLHDGNSVDNGATICGAITGRLTAKLDPDINIITTANVTDNLRQRPRCR